MVYEKKMVERSSCLKRKSSLDEKNNTNANYAKKEVEATERNVRFADLLGKQLVSVKTITPNSSFEDVTLAATRGGKTRNGDGALDLNNNFVISYKNSNFYAPNSIGRYLKCCFPQPTTRKDALENALEKQMVWLESALLGGGSNMVLIGLIRVRNVAYEKEVYVRYTMDNWVTYCDLHTDYLLQASCGEVDKFVFRLMVPLDFRVGYTVEFAVWYRAGGREYWDNNDGNNFVVKCCE